MKELHEPSTVEDRDRLYDLFSGCYDDAPDKERERMLARLVVALSHYLPASEVAAIVAAASPSGAAPARAGRRVRRA